MWTPTTLRENSRDHLRYGSELTDAHSALPAAAAADGRPRRWRMREIVNAIFYVRRAGCPWRMPAAHG